ncbi:MAG TPA: glycosyltransferase family 2 protein [Stellaceae bacterium]|nr:glycosyltransferase family 2 protein [Stellaceae bacterium]
MTGPESNPGDAPLVSVVVIGYNQQGYAPLAVQSVLAQTHARLECIFVDDGSSDSTFERVEALAETDPRLKVFRKENGGPASARNFGAARTSGTSEFVAFLDGDDLYRPDYLLTGLQYLRANPRVGVVIPSYDYIDAQGAPLPEQRRGHRWVPSPFWLPRALPDSEPETPFVTFYCGTGVLPLLLIRTSVYRQTEGWDEALPFVEDIDFLCQLSLITEVHSIPQRLVGYRIHSQQWTSGALTESKRPRLSAAAVQEKWNRRVTPDRRTGRIIGRACIYYRQIHLPLRPLRVAPRALAEFLRTPSRQRFSWFLELLWLFLRDFVYFKLFFWRSTRRYPATRFYESKPVSA